jgi:hypothetical protein
MDRRRFLQAASFGALALVVRRAFGDAAMPNIAAKKKAPGDPPDTLDLAAHVAKARARGVPLLVIVVPSDDTKVDVGEAWGELIHHGGDRTLPLGRADVVCASRAHAAELGAALSDDTLAVTVDTSGRARAFGGVLPAYPPSGMRVIRPGEDKGPTEEEVGKQRLDVMGKVVADALGSVPLSQARQLRAAVKAKLLDRPPPGSHWANASGCGPTRVEKTPEEKAERERREAEARKNGQLALHSIAGYGCGMGHVPAQARRFLYFFTRTDADSDES